MNIAAYLEQHSISQKAFGERIGASQGLVWQWINGQTRITVKYAKRIVRETAGQVTAHDCMPDTYPEGFEFPPEPEAAAA